MRHWLKMTASVIAASILIAGEITNAQAGKLSSSHSGFRATWNSLEFLVGGPVACRVTLEGSLHSRSITKVRGSLIGAVTRSIVSGCVILHADNGSETEPLGTAPQTLPWHLTYESFGGVLPSISEIRLLLSRFSFYVEAFGLCRGHYGTPEDNIVFNVSREESGGLLSIAPQNGTFHLREQLGRSPICPQSIAFAGIGSISELSSSTQITITLI